MDEELTYVLIHSPLVGPLTWRLVQQEMARRALDAIAPAILERPDSSRPFWQLHAESLAASLPRDARNRRLVLVAHSGAGPLLPAARQQLSHAIAAYIFVDAGLPRHDASRLDLMGLQDPRWAERFQHALAQGQRFPNWREEDLREIIPDDDLRREMVAEINPRSLPFFSEPIPVFTGWPDAPCAYIKLSPAYDWNYSQARQGGWPVREVNAGHFHMLVDPARVALLIVDCVEESVRRAAGP